jgi:hypothetical protein
MKSKVTGTYKVYEDNEIIHLIIHEETILSYDHAREINAYISTSYMKKKHLKLLDARGSFVFEEGAQHFFESPKVKFKAKAQAILISANTKQQIIDLFTGMNSRRLPTKIFVNYDTAIDWLTSFKNDTHKNAPEYKN